MAKLSASQRKLFASLATARGRREAGLFMANGWRTVSELLGHFTLRHLVATAAWTEDYLQTAERCLGRVLFENELLTATRDEIDRISTVTTPQPVVGIFELPEDDYMLEEMKPDTFTLILALDHIQDPGNLGTILRLADWFGVGAVIASRDTADIFSPKVLQSSMGAVARVKVVYCDLAQTLTGLKKEGWPICGTFLDGENIYKCNLPTSAVVVMGNEGNGISPEVAALVTDRLLIPPFPPGEETVESLNVGAATAITLSEFRRPRG